MVTIELPIYISNNEESIVTWLDCFAAILNRPLFDKENILHFNDEDKTIDKTFWWKLKKNVIKCLFRFYTRYGNHLFPAKGQDMIKFSI